MNEDNQSDSFGGEDEFDSSHGEDNVNDSNLTLEEINATLGRNYKDKPTALKALAETYKMVGEVGKIKNENKVLKSNQQSESANAERMKSIETELFYSNNPQYKPFRDTIEAMGGNPAEVVQKDAFKKVFDGMSELEKTKNAKSVLESNPRIGQAKTKIDEAKGLANVGKQSDANLTAVDAVLDAYDLH